MMSLLNPVGSAVHLHNRSRRPFVACPAAKKGQKVNDRGKVSSRPGPVSPRELKRQADEAKKAAQQQGEQQAARPAASVSDVPPQASPQPMTTTAAAAAAAPATPAAAAAAAAAPATPAVERAAPAAARSAPVPTAFSSAPTETPQVVVDRIFSRMVTCATVPVLTGIGLLVVIYFLKKQGGDDFPMWPAYLSQGFTLMGGLLGISYGALSASWDPSREGSTLGWTEFRANLPIFLSKDKDRK